MRYVAHIVRKPNLRQGRANTDYGKGFYTTVDFDQAARWARIRRDRAGGGNAVVSVYEVDDNLLNDAALKIMEYNGATKEWLDFVVANRRFAPLHYQAIQEDMRLELDRILRGE